MEIKDIYGTVLFTLSTAKSIVELVNAAVKTGANLYGANLSGANLTRANLTRAYLRGANLTGAYLTGANLTGANLTGAYLTGAYLTGAYLSGANLSGANLYGADLRGANLYGANLYGANLTGAKNVHWSVCPEIGPFHAFKKVKTPDGEHVVLEIRIDADAARVNGIGSRKCRAEHVYVVRVVAGPPAPVYKSPTQVGSAVSSAYRVGEYTVADSFIDDPRLECTGGIHFFMTFAEANGWGK